MMVKLEPLFVALADALDGELEIERTGRAALEHHASTAIASSDDAMVLPSAIAEVMGAPDAHPCSATILDTPLPWRETSTSNDPAYKAINSRKRILELVGPTGICHDEAIRVGLYGILPDTDYGIRTHPAEEIFVMLAGRARWLRGDESYNEYGVGARRHHPSMMPHATRTDHSAFLSLYVWRGEVSFENYVYTGGSVAPEK